MELLDTVKARKLAYYGHTMTVTDALAILHWLRLLERVNFKLALMAYRVLNGMAPSYLNLLLPVSNLLGCRRLRSSFTHLSRRTVCQQSAVARFLLQPPPSGTLYPATFNLHHLFLPFAGS